MARPLVVVREQYADVDWEEVRQLIISQLATFGFEEQAALYCRLMLKNGPQPGYRQAMRLAAAAILRIIKVHPASDEYCIAAAYRQLLQVATAASPEYPDRGFLKYLHRAMHQALVRTANTSAGLPDDPFADSMLHPVGVAGEAPQETEDVPYRRIKLGE